MIGLLKQNFFPDEPVIIRRTTDSNLDEKYGTIIGVASSCPEVDFYIVRLDNPLPEGWQAIMLIESCIDRLSNRERGIE